MGLYEPKQKTVEKLHKHGGVETAILLKKIGFSQIAINKTFDVSWQVLKNNLAKHGYYNLSDIPVDKRINPILLDFIEEHKEELSL